jgi:hypothetical protein
MKCLLVLLSLGMSAAPVQDATSQPQPLLKELQVDGATIFNREDILWMLALREGSALPQPPPDIAKARQEAYERDGYSEATTSGQALRQAHGRPPGSPRPGRICTDVAAPAIDLSFFLIRNWIRKFPPIRNV